MADILTCHLKLKMKSKTESSFLMYRLFVKINHLPFLFTVNLPLVEFIHILTVFNHPSISGTVYKLANRCLRIRSSWTKLHKELLCLEEIFLKNGYSEDFINKCFKTFMDSLDLAKETTLTVEKKPLVLVLLYLGSISLKLGLS